jgi:hypothetical protein
MRAPNKNPHGMKGTAMNIKRELPPAEKKEISISKNEKGEEL